MALLVARAHDDATATLQVVGRPVVPSYTAALHRFVDELGLREAVMFRGALSDAVLADAVADADVFVLPSRHEGFGVPVLEAMASGVPVVANDAARCPRWSATRVFCSTRPIPMRWRGRWPVCAARPGCVKPWSGQPRSASQRSTWPRRPTGRSTFSRRSPPPEADRRPTVWGHGSQRPHRRDRRRRWLSRRWLSRWRSDAADGLLHQRDEAPGGGGQVETGRPLPPGCRQHLMQLRVAQHAAHSGSERHRRLVGQHQTGAADGLGHAATP